MANGFCAIYGDRPAMCRSFPTIDDDIPPGCGYSFENGNRVGSCTPNECEGENCCAVPRLNGEPESICPSDSDDAGVQCKNLRWSEEEEVGLMSKVASDPSVDKEFLNAVDNGWRDAE